LHQLHLTEGLHADINGVGVLDHVQVPKIEKKLVPAFAGSSACYRIGIN
jgi:hypothetical protein